MTYGQAVEWLHNNKAAVEAALASTAPPTREECDLYAAAFGALSDGDAAIRPKLEQCVVLYGEPYEPDPGPPDSKKGNE